MTDLIETYQSKILPNINWEQELSELSPLRKGEHYILTCPQCQKREAFLYPNTGMIACNRKNNCGYQTPFLTYKHSGVYPKGQNWVDAIQELGKSYGIFIDNERVQEHLKADQKRQSDQEILTKVWNYFIKQLEGSEGENYLNSRKFPTDQNLFGMYPNVEKLKNWLTAQQIDLERCQELGLMRSDFEGRLIGVWKTKSRDICNFWARSLDGSQPKYLRLKRHPDLQQNYPQGSEFIREGSVIWVEGHLDVIAAHVSGLKNVVGCGTASVPAKALDMLKPQEVILCLDKDQAGQEGMFRFIEKHLKDDLRIFVAQIPYEDCKDLADVYEKYGDVAVHELFEKHHLIHGLRFVADFILKKQQEEIWTDYTKTQALSELKQLSEKVPCAKQWEINEYFWPTVMKELNLEEEEALEGLIDSVEEKQHKETQKNILQTLAQDISELVNMGKLEEAKKRLEKSKNELSQISLSHDLLIEILKPSSEEAVLEEMQTVSEGIESGYKLNDDLNIIFPGGAISVIAAPTGHGKTRALINFSLGALENHPDKSVYFFTYEENQGAITSLFLNTYINETLSKNNRGSIKHYFKHAKSGEEAFRYFIPDKKIPITEGQDQPLRDYFLQKKKEFFEKFITSGRLKIIYCDYDATQLFDLIRGLKERKEDLGLVCIDYIQLLRDSSEKGKSRQEELKGICLKMKDCAVDTGLPILAAAQFNREVQDKKEMHPTKIGEAGDIERIANLILGMYDLREDQKLHIEVLKGREIGAGHQAEFAYSGNTGKISNIPFPKVSYALKKENWW